MYSTKGSDNVIVKIFNGIDLLSKVEVIALAFTLIVLSKGTIPFVVAQAIQTLYG